MRKGLVAHVLLVAALVLAGAIPTQAQERPQYFHRIGIVGWPASASIDGGAGGSWTTFLWGLSYGFTSPDAPWGFGLEVLTGSRSDGLGTDTLWRVDGAYRVAMERVTWRALASFRSVQAGAVSTSHLGVGLDAMLPIVPFADSGGWSLTVGAAAYLGPRSGTDWSVAVRYKMPSPPVTALVASLPVAATTAAITRGHDWDFSFGFRESSFSGSTYRWSGFFLTVGKSF
ncbi:MAG: hypothetical protein QN122_06585 [Armatimonadota bacterium]|nr:hypothetical protein [Armatimonadota bacterium]MDR7448739.1 hypothetical protein [Armatimonadota bacterium]MDR7460466.1 hypothetical protein [Armatimonadota bacterium]MDR7479077.1 hypothetical protein [Armatimonadota bacterium]MDR7488647.1 hypothetical protein [Armatimonadota bacterium]